MYRRQQAFHELHFYRAKAYLNIDDPHGSRPPTVKDPAPAVRCEPM
jgi:hypothetical protein